jgi:hypothetical protein
VDTLLLSPGLLIELRCLRKQLRIANETNRYCCISHDIQFHMTVVLEKGGNNFYVAILVVRFSICQLSYSKLPTPIPRHEDCGTHDPHHGDLILQIDLSSSDRFLKW